ncbi:kinesin-like protein KIF28 [Brevipalpus obovatus]|uniref:kinesin-like protein KIF28 n=1 Tax=Brevipalpus obovatus TaxID=246614 RepID=UPI003D9EDC92
MSAMSASSDHIKVAVRVRPFNQREKHRNARCIVDMEENTTILYNPNNSRDEPKKFTFDHSYWSHDGFIESKEGAVCRADNSHFNGFKYVDQDKVYDDLGKTVLKDAMDGYNAAIFAYGQTGSGKSYTVIGFGANKGIVPRLCSELFETIDHRKQAGDNTRIEVQISMLEIYNEVVRDLLNTDTSVSAKKKGLKVREHPSKGFYAEGLKNFLVTNKKEIEDKIEEGTTYRSIASTNMNESSSRAHTIVQIHISQRVRNSYGHETSRSSIIHLVDLAGSERLSGTMAIGDRLKEGVSINQSLSCLGNCIQALAEKSSDKSIRVPYRDSVLTRLLMNVLAGNSKTVMIATISPADINYDETLSTLRYADRAKRIRVHATVNESSTDKLLRQLREENDRLKRTLDRGVVELPGENPSLSENDLLDMRKKFEEEMKALMAENDRQMIEMKQSYEEKLQEKRRQEESDYTEADREKLEKDKRCNPFLSNLNFDEQLSGKIVHIIRKGANRLGKGDKCNIMLHGPSIQDHHANIYRKDNDTVILEHSSDDCRILLNGDPVTNKVQLNHNDRLLFGTTQLFLFMNPMHQKKSKKSFHEVTFELAQEEIASKAGFDVVGEDQSMETALLNKSLLEMLPAIDEANAISQELGKNIKMEIVLVASSFLGKNSERTEVMVKYINLETEQEFLWTKEKFFNRLYIMKEIYQNHEDGEENWNPSPDRDPFYEDPRTEVLIGITQVFLQPLAFQVELKEQLEVTDYKGVEVGIINVEIVPCSADGRELDEMDDAYVDAPSELIGKDIHFVVKIHGCRGLPPRFTDVYGKYRVFIDEEDTKTETISDTSNPDFNHRKMFHFNPVTKALIDYLRDGYILVQVLGRQMARRATSKQSGRLTKQMMQEDILNQASNLMQGFKMNGRNVDPNKQSIIVELLLMKKQQARQQQRIENIRKLVDVFEHFGRSKIPVNLVKELISTTTPDSAQQIISQIASSGKLDDNDDDVVRSTACNLL